MYNDSWIEDCPVSRFDSILMVVVSYVTILAIVVGLTISIFNVYIGLGIAFSCNLAAHIVRIVIKHKYLRRKGMDGSDV